MNTTRELRKENDEDVIVQLNSTETSEQIRLRHPGATLAEWEDVYAETEASCKTEPVEITEDNFLKALNVLPPVRWTKRSDSESFKLSERLYGSITAIYARIGDRYYTFSDNIALPHDDVISRIKQFSSTVSSEISENLMRLNTTWNDGYYLWAYFTTKAEAVAAAMINLIVESSPALVWRVPVERNSARTSNLKPLKS